MRTILSMSINITFVSLKFLAIRHLDSLLFWYSLKLSFDNFIYVFSSFSLLFTRPLARLPSTSTNHPHFLQHLFLTFMACLILWTLHLTRPDDSMLAILLPPLLTPQADTAYVYKVVSKPKRHLMSLTTAQTTVRASVPCCPWVHSSLYSHKLCQSVDLLANSIWLWPCWKMLFLLHKRNILFIYR